MRIHLFVFQLTVLALCALTACADTAPTRAPLRAGLATATPRDLGAFVFGTATPTRTPTATGTPGPSPTPTLTPTPVNRDTLKGLILFPSSRPAPQTEPAVARFMRGARQVIWKFDPATGKVEPCDPPAPTPTPTPAGTPTRALNLPSLQEVTAVRVSHCETAYTEMRRDQTFSADKVFEVFVGNDTNAGHPQIFVLNHQTNARMQVTKFGAHAISFDPVFAPDGYHIAFIANNEGPEDLWTITRDGTELKRVTRLPGQGWSNWEWIKKPTWSPDGTQIAFWSNKVSGARQIWIVRADGTNLRTVSADPRPAEDWDPVWIR